MTIVKEWSIRVRDAAGAGAMIAASRESEDEALSQAMNIVEGDPDATVEVWFWDSRDPNNRWHIADVHIDDGDEPDVFWR